MAELSKPDSGSPAPAIPGLPEDWHLRATSSIVENIDNVRKKTSGPAIGVARMVVFGLVAFLIALVAVPLLLIGIVRLLNDVLPPGVWLTYFILGGIFLAIGLFLWSRRPRGAAS